MGKGAKPDSLNLISKTHMVDGENWPLKAGHVPLPFTYTGIIVKIVGLPSPHLWGISKSGPNKQTKLKVDE